MDGDSELVARVLSGEPAAFVLLVRQYQALVYHVVSGVVSDRDAREDVCQDTFIKVHDKLASWSGAGSLKSWIARVAHTTALNQLRSSSRRHDKDSLEMFEDASGDLNLPAPDQVDATVEGEDEAARLRRLVAELPAPYREVVQLHYLQDMSVAEIAAATDQAAGTVKSNLFRARRRLAEMLESHDMRDDHD
jgi:RNA polymerase sigma-70 factor (ECF subfamily)